ncbi:MAG: Rnf-Nqr domain containing protein [Halanaerobiales bacterium]
MGQIFNLFLGAILWQNVVLTRLLSLSPFLVERKSTIKDMTLMGLFTTCFITVFSLLAWVISELILVKFKLTYLTNLIFFFFLFLVIFMLWKIFVQNKSNPADWTLYLPDVFFNSALLGIVLINMENGTGWLENGALALGAGLGFTILLIVVEGMKERLEGVPLPAWLKGVPIQLIALGILALAVSGFSGI